MNELLYDKINLTQIGPNCYFNSLSCSLDYMEMVYLTLGYTSYSFFYNNINDFLRIDLNKDIKEYLSTNNPLIFNERPDSFMKSVYSEYSDKKVNDMHLIDFIKSIEINFDSNIVRNTLKKEYLDNDVALMIDLNVSKLKEDYKTIYANIPQGDNSMHAINIFDINENFIPIIDTQFKAKGYIKTSSVLTAYNSVNNKRIQYIDPTVKKSCGEEEQLLKQHLYNSLNNQKIDDIKYDNLKAIDLFIEDMPYIINECEKKYGIFSYPFLSYIMDPHRTLRRGCGALYDKISMDIKYDEFDNIKDSAIMSGKLWYILDATFDKNFLKNNKISKIKEKIIELLIQIREVDKKTYELMNNLYMKI